MSMIIAALIFVLVLAVGIAHLLWAIGSRWPIRDPELLARTVIGRPGVTRVSRGNALLRGVVALVIALVAPAVADHDAGGIGLTLLGAVIAVALIARGVLGYTAGWRAAHPVEPFATLDRRNYSPAYVIIGVGFALLVIMRLL